MSFYCYWITAQEFDNGDIRIARLRDGEDGEESALVIPLVERARIARRLLQHHDAIDADIDRVPDDVLVLEVNA